MDAAATLDFLGAHAVPGLETYAAGVYTRVVDAPRGPALVTLGVGDGAVQCRIVGAHAADVAGVVTRVRGLLDLDADPHEVDAALASSTALAPLVSRRPGLRAPGSVDGFETAVRTVVGQQISLAGARTVLGRIVAEHGRPVFDGTWRSFPTADRLAAVDPTTLPMPRARGRSVQALAAAVAEGSIPLDGPGLDRKALLALPGIGPWTADYLAMRVGGDRDVLLASDLVVKRAAVDLGLDLTGGRPDWAPYRTYATYHLWAHLVADQWRAQR
jgi:AraC family transcriptional regulator, regulatory protein of adaptative response / DNA-3-methyladenine glycosylase II